MALERRGGLQVAEAARSADESPSERLTLGEALKDLGWFAGLFSLIVGGPSVLSIYQAVFEDHQLIAPFQAIVDGWNDFLALVASWVEPAVAPLVDWLNATFGWSLFLYPHWRPLFALAAVLVLAMVRSDWRTGKKGAAASAGVFMGLGALLGAIGAGLVPLIGGAWTQGAGVGLPVALTMFASGLPLLAGPIRHGKLVGVVFVLAIFAFSGALFGGFAFLVGAGLSFIPGLSAGAGVLVLAGFVASVGVVSFASGLRSGKHKNARFGLTVLGGFTAAGILLVADAAVKLMS